MRIKKERKESAKMEMPTTRTQGAYCICKGGDEDIMVIILKKGPGKPTPRFSLYVVRGYISISRPVRHPDTETNPEVRWRETRIVSVLSGEGPVPRIDSCTMGYRLR